MSEMKAKRRKFGQLAHVGVQIVSVATLFTVLLDVLVHIVTYEWLPVSSLAKCFVMLVVVGVVISICFNNEK